MSSIKQIIANRRTARKLQQERRGLWGRTPEQISETSRRNGKIVGAKLYREGKGLFAMSAEEKSAAGKKGGPIGGRKTIKGALSAAGKIGGIKGGAVQGQRTQPRVILSIAPTYAGM